jgi:hypothetical protein
VFGAGARSFSFCLEVRRFMRNTFLSAMLVLCVAASPSAQDARYNIPYATTTAAVQVHVPLGIDVPAVPKVAVQRPVPKHERLPLPEGTGGNPLPASAPVQLVGDPGTPDGPGDVNIWYSRSIVQPGYTTNWPPEPQALVEHDAVLYTHNAGAAVSGDSGASWSRIAPETLFPAADGGFCCDQRLVRSRATATTSRTRATTSMT